MAPRKLKAAWIAATIIVLLLGAIVAGRLLEMGAGKIRSDRARRPIPPLEIEALVNLFLAEGSLLERRGIRLPAAD
ncbi:MAG: hypothetical protein RQ753_09775 [Desulfurivibrionaceae bacterium]|nr:hypothetical protein [Desulfurivibrionaceae bacterium]